MAGNLLAELWVKIGANIDDLTRQLKAGEDNLNTFGAKINDSQKKLASAAKGMAVFAGAGIAMGAAITKTFAGFEQSMANVGSVVGASADQMNKLSSYARKMGAESVFSASEAADAMYYLGSAGYDTEQIMASLKGTLELAAATQHDLADTTKIVVGTLNGFGLGAESAERVSNVFSAAISSTMANMTKLGDSMKYVAPIASGLGLSVEQTTATLGKLYNAGFEASQAGTYLRSGLLALQAPTDQAKEAMKALGLSYEDLNPQTQDLVSIFNKLKKAGADARDKGDELAAIFGKRAVSAFQVLIREGGDSIDKLEKKITGTTKASKMAAMQIDTFQGSVKLMKSALEESAIQLGSALVPAIRSVVDAIKNLSVWFNSLPSWVKSSIVTVGALAVGLAAIGAPVAMLLSKLPLIVAGFKMVNAAMTTSLGVVGAVALAIGALVAAWVYFTNKSEKAKKAQLDNVKALGENVNAMRDHKQEVKDTADTYIELAEKSERTEEENAKLKESYVKLKAEYPDLISDTGDYASHLDEVKGAASRAAKEVAKYQEMATRAKRLEILVQMQQLQQSIREAKEDAADTSVWERMGDSIGSVFSTAIRADKLTRITQNLEVLKKAATDAAGVDISKLGKAGGKVEVDSLARAIEKIAADGENVNTILSEQFKITARIANVNENLAVFDSQRQDQLTSAQKKRKSDLEDELETLTLINNAIQAGVAATSELTGDQAKLANLKAQLAIMDQQADVKTELEQPDPQDGTGGGGGGDDKAKKRAEQRAKLEYELKKKSLEMELALIEPYKEKELAKAMEYLDKEYELKKFVAAHEYDEAIKQANELGLGVAKVKEAYAKQEEILTVQKEQAKLEIMKSFFDKNADLMWRQLSVTGTANEADLQSYKKMLQQKLTELEGAGKKMSEEWLDIYEKLKQAEDTIGALKIKKLDFAIKFTTDPAEYNKALEAQKAIYEEMLKNEEQYSDRAIELREKIKGVQDQINKPVEAQLGYNIQQGETTDELGGGTEQLVTALEAYKEYLVQRLDATRQYSEEYYSLMEQIGDVNKRIFETANRNVISAAKFMSGEISKLSDRFIDSAVQKGELLKIRFTDIFLNIRDAFKDMVADMIKTWIKAQLQKMILNLFTGGAGGASGVTGLIAGGGVGGGLSTAAYGGEVTKTGPMIVHRKERIQPASIVRKSRESNEKAMGMGKQTVFNNTPINLTLNNPAVDDEKYWREVVEEKLNPVLRKINRRF